MTWAARPDLPMRHLLESSQQLDNESAGVQDQEISMMPEHQLHAFDSYMPPVYANLPRMHNINMDSSSSVGSTMHNLPY